MVDDKEKLARLVLEEDISSILLMSEKLELEDEVIRNLLEQLAQEGVLNGYLTEDGKRFFRRDAVVSDKPIIHHKTPPSRTIEKDEKAQKSVAIFGMFMIVIGFIMLLTSQEDISIENFATALMLVGGVFAMCGCYIIGRQKTI